MTNKQSRDVHEYIANEELRVHTVGALIKNNKQVEDFTCAGAFMDFILDYIDNNNIDLGMAVELPETLEKIYYKVNR